MLNLEKRLVEEWAIERLVERGWKYIEADKLNRSDLEEPLLIDILKPKILEINKEINLTEADLKKILNELELVYSDQNGHRTILRYFKYGVPIKTEKDRISEKIQLFDYKNPQNNEFIVTNQFKFFGKEKIRLDIVLFVNGIPLVNIECKNPYTDKYDYFDAYRQIKRYEKEAPELYKYIQIGIGFAEVVKYFPIVPWHDDVKQEIWRWEDYKDDEAIFEMLRPGTLLDILKNFLFFREFRGQMTKVIGRYMQYRAVNKIYQRVMDNLSGKTYKNKGLIWHWQGSGKTLTMIFSAHKLYNDLGKPTIFFIVDRRDLERQFDDELKALDLGNIEYEKIESINSLREVLCHDEYRGKRGLFLTLIHKFNLDEEFILGELEKKGEIKSRKDIICFLDEVHRSQYGKLAMKMNNILRNAFFFGFTGTPISYADRNTFKKFGYIYEDEKEFYLDKYFIDEAERDGFIVPIVYELKKEKIRLKDEDLEWYLEQIDIEDIADEAEISLLDQKVRERLDEIKVILENPKEIEMVCQDIAKHYTENFDGRLKGLIVTGSRTACVRYKEILDKYLPSEYSEVVITFAQDNNEEVQAYRKKLIERYQINDTNRIIEQIVEKFRKEENPKLLIVTDMLITGFDEPKLGVIYLHKLLKNHRLLQTIARVNRPHIAKSAGLIVDYVGIFRFLEKALKVYLDEEIKIIKKEIKNKDQAFDEFLKILNELKNIFGDIVGNFERSSFDEAIEIVKKAETELKFVNLYKTLRGWYEILSTDERMLNYLKDYKWFTALYQYYKKLKRPEIDEAKFERYFKKTLSIIYDLTEVSEFVRKTGSAVIDLNYIKQIKNSDLTEEQKVVGVLYALKHICYLKEKNPIYKTIAERVRELIEKWEKDLIDLNIIQFEIEGILNYIEEKEREREASGLNELEFGFKLILEKYSQIERNDIYNVVKEMFNKIKGYLVIPNWNKNPHLLKAIESDIRKFLAFQIRPKYRLTKDDYERLHKEITDFLINYE